MKKQCEVKNVEPLPLTYLLPTILFNLVLLCNCPLYLNFYVIASVLLKSLVTQKSQNTQVLARFYFRFSVPYGLKNMK